MDANILCTLLAQQIDPAKFQLWGLEIHWIDPVDNTPENMAIVEDVIENYETLATECLAELEATERRIRTSNVIREIRVKRLLNNCNTPEVEAIRVLIKGGI